VGGEGGGGVGLGVKKTEWVDEEGSVDGGGKAGGLVGGESDGFVREESSKLLGVQGKRKH